MSSQTVSTSASNGATFVSFAADRAGNGSIYNDTGVSLDVRLNPDNVYWTTLASGSRLPFPIVWSCGEIAVRRTDQVATAVTVELVYSLGAEPPSDDVLAAASADATTKMAAHNESATAHLCPITNGCVGAWHAKVNTLTDGKIAALTPLLPGLPSLTQSVAANRWAIVGEAADPSGASTNTGFDLSASISVGSQSYSLIVVTAIPPSVFAAFAIQSLTENHFQYTTKTMLTGGQQVPGVAQDDVNVWAISSSTAGAVLYRNGASMTVPTLTSEQYTWTKLLTNNSGAASFKSPIIAMYVYNRALSSHEIARVASLYGVQRKPVANFVGDSITTGYFAGTFATCFASIAARLTGRTCVNGGGAGWKTTGIDADPPLAKLFFVGLSNTYVYAFGTNDLAANDSASTVSGKIQGHIAALRLARPSARIVISTVLPRSASFSGGQTADGFDTARLELNANIVANAVSWGANAVADCGGDPVIGPKAAASNASYYQDGIHPTNTVHAIMAGIVATAIGVP